MKKRMPILIAVLLILSIPYTAYGSETTEKETSFQEIVAVDNEQCTIKITGIEPDNMWGYTLNAYLENKSDDKSYLFVVSSASVNGVETEPLYAHEVAAGKRSNEDINFLDSGLSDKNIGEITDIEITFRVHDAEDWTADDVANETIHIYPMGEEKATTFVRESQPADTVIVDDENITVIVTDYNMDDIWGYNANLYLVNKTDKELTFSVDDASINGFMADAFWASNVSPGKSTFKSITWFNSELEKNGITDVETIEMVFRAHDANDWSAEDIFNETITLNP